MSIDVFDDEYMKEFNEYWSKHWQCEICDSIYDASVPECAFCDEEDERLEDGDWDDDDDYRHLTIINDEDIVQ